MTVNIDRDFQIALTTSLLTSFALLGSLTLYKIVMAKRNNAKFLLIFYLFVLLDILVYAAMTTYQIVRFIYDLQMHLIVLMIINVYSMILQAALLFLLSFYWKETQAMLRGSGLNSQQPVTIIKKQLKLRLVCLSLWFLFYTAILTYALINETQINNSVYQGIFYFGGQGFSTLIFIWANLSQVLSAKKFSFTLKRYQSLVSYQMNKRKFRCIYWVATTINFVRLFYLIAAIIIFKIYSGTQIQQWMVILVYTASALIPLAIYLYSFRINNEAKIQTLQSFSEQSPNSVKQTNGFYEPVQIGSLHKQNKLKQNRESFNESQISGSYDGQ